MRRVDCFKFCAELDLLELRLHILEEIIDWFVLVESPVTHTGHAKPLYYELNRKRFSRWADRIRHVVVEDAPMPPSTNFDRDRHQMNASMRGLPPLQSSDVVIVGDLDEIPNPDTIKTYRPESGIAGLSCYNSFFFINCEAYQVPWYNPKIAPYSVLLRVTPVGMRDYNAEGWGHLLLHGGWHFSYCGGIKAFEYKIRSYSHADEIPREWTDESLVRWILQSPQKRGEELIGMPLRLRKIDATFPRYVREHHIELQDKGLICKA